MQLQTGGGGPFFVVVRRKTEKLLSIRIACYRMAVLKTISLVVSSSAIKAALLLRSMCFGGLSCRLCSVEDGGTVRPCRFRA